MNQETFEVNDRNIRVYGLETQKLLFESNVLLINLTPALFELGKNLILSGTKLTLFDDQKKVNEQDIRDNFFLSNKNLQENRDECCKKVFHKIKEAADIKIIKNINDIKNSNIKYACVDLENFFDDFLKIEKIINECEITVYYMKVEKDKFIMFNNLTLKQGQEIPNKDDVVERFQIFEDDADFCQLEDDEKKENSEKEVLIEYEKVSLEEKISLLKKNLSGKFGDFISYSIKYANILLENLCQKSNLSEFNPVKNVVNYILGGIACKELVICIGKKKNPNIKIYFFDAFNEYGNFIP